MKLALKPLATPEYSYSRFSDILQRIETQGNLLAEGRLQGRHFTATSIPTTGDFAQGDIIWKSDPTEAGSASSKYVILGWVCTVAGSPGTLLEMRVLTGN